MELHIVGHFHLVLENMLGILKPNKMLGTTILTNIILLDLKKLLRLKNSVIDLLPILALEVLFLSFLLLFVVLVTLEILGMIGLEIILLNQIQRVGKLLG